MNNNEQQFINRYNKYIHHIDVTTGFIIPQNLTDEILDEMILSGLVENIIMKDDTGEHQNYPWDEEDHNNCQCEDEDGVICTISYIILY